MRFINTSISTLTVLAVALGSSRVFAQDSAQDVVQDTVQDTQAQVQNNTVQQNNQSETNQGQLDYVLCPTVNDIKCVNGTHFMRCGTGGYWRASMECAKGTICVNDKCDHGDYVPSSIIFGEGGADNGGSEGNGGEANGGEANGGEANGGEANGGEANGGEANGGEANGGEANGGEANGGEANGGEANGSEANGSEGNGGEGGDDVVYETITSTSCDDDTATDELTDCDEASGEGDGLDNDQGGVPNVSSVDTVNGSSEDGMGDPDQYEGLNNDTSKDGAANGLLALNGLGAFASLVSAIVASTLLSFA